MTFGPGHVVVGIIGGWWLMTLLVYLSGAPSIIMAMLVGGGIGHLIGLALVVIFFFVRYHDSE